MFTPEKQIRPIFRFDWSYVKATDASKLRVTKAPLLDRIKLSTFFENFAKAIEIWQIDQFNIKHGKIHI